jgi:transposase-like protein
MTSAREDTGFTEQGQVESLCMDLPGGLRLEVADRWANRRGVMIFLRCLRGPDGQPWMTYEQIAQQLGYADRRNVHNFWAEFQACGEDLEAFLSRRKKVDAQVVALCQQIWKAHPLWSVGQVHAELVRRFPQQGEGLTEQNIRTAGQQIGFLGVQQVLRRQLAEGKVHYQESFLLQALWTLADRGAFAQAQAAGEGTAIPEELEVVRPQVALQQASPAVKAEAVETLCACLLEGETSPCALARLWEGVIGRVMLAFVLYYHGLSLEVIGGFFGVHKTTVMRWMEPLAHLCWQEVIQKGKRYFSGVVALDEKWVQVDGVWWYLFAAVDSVSGFPLHVALLPSNSQAYCRLFLLQIKALGYVPRVIITDGWDAYASAIAAVFPNAEHLLCRFHAIAAAFRRLKEAIQDWKGRAVWAEKLKKLFHTSSKQTVQRRLERLKTQAQGTPAKAVIDRLFAKLPRLLPAVGSTFRPSTANAAERFLGAFDRFYRLKGPFQNHTSAEKHIRLFLLGYVFHTFSVQAQQDKQGLCPLQLAGYQVAHIPLFHMFNRPDPDRLRQGMAQGYAQVA